MILSARAQRSTGWETEIVTVVISRSRPSEQSRKYRTSFGRVCELYIRVEWMGKCSAAAAGLGCGCDGVIPTGASMLQ